MIEKLLFWNIRSVKTQKAFDRLIDLNKRQQYSFIALMEPFQGDSELDQYKRKLGFQKAHCNCSSKNWVFWYEEWESTHVLDT